MKQDKVVNFRTLTPSFPIPRSPSSENSQGNSSATKDETATERHWGRWVLGILLVMLATIALVGGATRSAKSWH